MSEETSPESILSVPEAIPETGDIPPVDPTPETDNPPPYDWKKDIHPDVANDKLWESIPDIKTLTKMAADNARYNVGAVKIPAPDAPQDQWDAFYKKLGKPDTIDAYTVSEKGQGDETVTKLRSAAHRASLTPAQWNVMRDGYADVLEEQIAVQREEMRQAEDTLKAEWGGAYEGNVKRMQKAIRLYGGDEALQSVLKGGLGNDVYFLKMMDRFSKALRDERIIRDDTDSPNASSDNLKAELDDIAKSEAYLSPHHADHEKAMKRAKYLFEVLYN